ncbi:GPW/gp25 family protein [Aquimarina pacifica]|uniref:GPW/gp25 family protein n=1 Tax=Aquimarina pacifica TaxID=1296415 RepID=UPI000472E9A4|nr:GPW/gp25 family protein [Aquimarina pacifica]
MITSYYSLPLQTNKIVKNIDIDQCSIQQSIIHFIHLITTSYLGECTFDETFGCSIWNVDFDNLTSTNRLRDIVSESLVDNITSQEKRLKRVTTEVIIRQDEFREGQNNNRVKKRVDIKIKGIIRQTNEPFSYLERFYIAPLSY